MLGFERRIPPVSLKSGGCSSVPWNVANLLTVRSTPSKPWMKSMCHQSRRNSPSVTACRPTSSCSLTASLMHSSSTARSAARSISPSLCLARAAWSACGRSRLPTWSARNGGFMKGLLRRLFQREHLVGGFPGELGLFATEVAIGGGLLVDRAQQVEHLDDALRPQIEVLDDQRRERVVGHLPGALGRHHDAGGAGHADGVGQLHQALRRETGGDDILGDVTRRVRRGAVDLGGILPREGAAAVRRRAAVGVADELAAGDSAVALWPA